MGAAAAVVAAAAVAAAAAAAVAARHRVVRVHKERRLLDDVVADVEDEVGVLDGDVDDVVRRERRAADVL